MKKFLILLLSSLMLAGCSMAEDLDNTPTKKVENYLNKYQDVQDIVLHFDNDRAGRQATKAMIIALDKYNVYDIPAPYGKDINDYLCYSIGLKNRQEIDRYKMKKEQSRVPI